MHYSAQRQAMEALFAGTEACAECLRVFIRFTAARDCSPPGNCSPPGQNPAKNDTLRFRRFVFALEIVQATTALRKLVVLFAHSILFTGEEAPGQ
jgi:hypothetical protein